MVLTALHDWCRSVNTPSSGELEQLIGVLLMWTAGHTSPALGNNTELMIILHQTSYGRHGGSLPVESGERVEITINFTRYRKDT